MNGGRRGAPAPRAARQSPGHHPTRPHGPAALQPKAATPQAKKGPSAPPVYRPQPVPKVLQKKSATPPRPPAAGARAPTPAPPPVYRPQPVPKVLQRKAAAVRPPAGPVAPAAYSPNSKKVVQPKASAAAQARNPPQAPPAGRPVQRTPQPPGAPAAPQPARPGAARLTPRTPPQSGLIQRMRRPASAAAPRPQVGAPSRQVIQMMIGKTAQVWHVAARRFTQDQFVITDRAQGFNGQVRYTLAPLRYMYGAALYDMSAAFYVLDDDDAYYLSQSFLFGGEVVSLAPQNVVPGYDVDMEDENKPVVPTLNLTPFTNANTITTTNTNDEYQEAPTTPRSEIDDSITKLMNFEPLSFDKRQVPWQCAKGTGTSLSNSQFYVDKAKSHIKWLVESVYGKEKNFEGTGQNPLDFASSEINKGGGTCWCFHGHQGKLTISANGMNQNLVKNYLKGGHTVNYKTDRNPETKPVPTTLHVPQEVKSKPVRIVDAKYESKKHGRKLNYGETKHAEMYSLDYDSIHKTSTSDYYGISQSCCMLCAAAMAVFGKQGQVAGYHTKNVTNWACPNAIVWDPAAFRAFVGDEAADAIGDNARKRDDLLRAIVAAHSGWDGVTARKSEAPFQSINFLKDRL